MEAAAAAAAAVLAPTTTDLSHLPIVAGYDFNEGVDYERLLQSYLTTGFQATNLALAVQQVRLMVRLAFSLSLYLSLSPCLLPPYCHPAATPAATPADQEYLLAAAATGPAIPG